MQVEDIDDGSPEEDMSVVLLVLTMKYHDINVIACQRVSGFDC